MSFENSDTNKRYFTQSYYLKQRFGCKVIKISLNGGFTCPNLDGSRGIGGCTYCSSGSGDFAGNPNKSISEQFNDVKAKLNEKWSSNVYIPYFQANTSNRIDIINARLDTFKAMIDKLSDKISKIQG